MALINYLFTSIKPIHQHIRADTCTYFTWFNGVSRCNYKPDLFQHKLICSTVDEVLQSGCDNISWDECMDRSAMNLHNLNSTIYLMWSGGIDSTGILIAILKNWPKQDLGRVIVLLSRESVEEFSGFYSRFIFPNFKILNSITTDLEELAKSGYIVTGEPADQLLGMNQIKRMISKHGIEVVTGDWKKFAELYFVGEAGKTVPASKIVETYIPLVEECPWKIKSYFEFLWWINFSLKYQHVLVRSFAYGTWKDPKFYFSKMIHFYNTNEFNMWSITNVQKYLLDKDNKKLPKQYIIDFTNIDSVARHQKRASLQNTWIGKSVNIALNDKWEFVNFEEVINERKL